MMMPAAIDMLPSPAERAGMREGTWLTLEEDVGFRVPPRFDSHTRALFDTVENNALDYV